MAPTLCSSSGHAYMLHITLHIQFSQNEEQRIVVADSVLMSTIPVAYCSSLYCLSTHFLCSAVRHLFGVLSNSFYVRSTETGMWWIDGTTIACCLHVNQSSLIIVLSKHSICFSFILSFYYP